MPVRDRTTTPRTPTQSAGDQRYYSADPFADAFRSSNPRATASSSSSASSSSPHTAGWEASKDDYVEVDVDPFDPFSASNRNASTRSSWPDDEEEANDDWYPILLVMGFAGVLWVVGLITNALPAATPSVGM